jgi:hypothetical protein
LKFGDGTSSHNYEISIRFSFIKYTDSVSFPRSSNGILIIAYMLNIRWGETIDPSNDVKDGERGDVATEFRSV